MAGPRPQAHAGRGLFPSAGSNPNSPPSEVTEVTARQAKTKAALDMVPILGQGLVSGTQEVARLRQIWRAGLPGACFSGWCDCCCEPQGWFLLLLYGYLGITPSLLFPAMTQSQLHLLWRPLLPNSP